jgi:hypothetical protein
MLYKNNMSIKMLFEILKAVYLLESLSVGRRIILKLILNRTSMAQWWVLVSMEMVP